LAHTKLKPRLESYTFSAWAKPSGQKSMGAICGRTGFHNDIGYSPAKRFYFETFNTDRKAFSVTSTKEYEPGTWHHIAGVFDKASGKIMLYVDGEAMGEKILDGEHFRYGEDLFIGCANPASPSFGYWFSGAVDEVRIYKRALSSADVRAVYDALSASMGPVADPRYGAVGRSDQPAWFEPMIEIVPPVSDALRARAASMTPISAALGKSPEGLPALLFNNTPVPFVGGDVWWGHGMSKVFLAPYFDAGMEIINLQVNIALGSLKISPSATNYNAPYWTGKGQYDPSGLEQLLYRPLRSNPNAKIMFWLIIDVYPEWPTEYPDELVQNENGEYGYGSSHFNGYSKDIKVSGKGSAERSVWSFFSGSFRDGTSDMLSNFVRDVEKIAPGRAVAGYIIGGGVDYQMYHWNAPNSFLLKPGMWSDYSPAAKKAWKAWLKKKYGSKEALASAWNVNADAVTFDPPKFNELQGTEFFHDPTKERRAMDWKRFITSGRQELISHFAKVLKSASPRPAVVGICSGMSGGRRDTTTTEEFLRDPNIDFLFHQPTYSQRTPPNYGGINAQLSSHAVNGKLFLLDLDHPTWMQKPSSRTEIGAGIVHDANVQGWAKDIDTLRAMWRREYAHLWTVNAGAFWDHVFGQPSAYADPTIIAEMKFLVDMSKTVKKPSPQKPVAEVAVIYDEKAVDYLKQGVSLNGEWHTTQNNELLASGVPYGMYYAEDLREGKVPKAKMYIMQNLMNLDTRLVAAIEKIKSDAATVVFLRDTGYEQSFTSMDTVNRAVGITLARLKDAPSPSFSINEKHPLVDWEKKSDGADDSSVTWPSECSVFGPFEKSTPTPALDVLSSIPSSLSLGGVHAEARRVTTKGSLIDLQTQFGGPMKAERAGYVFFEVESTKDQEVRFGAGADWWMQWWVNGKPVFDTLEKGNERVDYTVRAYSFKVTLRRGRNIVVARVLSGSAGFVLAAGGPNELNASSLFGPSRERIRKEEHTLAVVDPKAVVLSAYADDAHAGFAVKDNGDHTSVFIGTRILSRDMIAALAKQAKAWRLTDPGVVCEALEDLIMLHPLAAGPVTVRLKRPSSLVECAPGTRKSASSLTHTLDLPVGGTYLFMLR
ncbi:MAG: LamG domain-containing protein, partial [Spirochaetota bacterium]